MEKSSDRSELKELYAIRDGIEADRPFIFSTFLRGLYYGDSFFSRTPKKTFMEQYHRVLDHILALPSVSVRVACLKDDPEVILGYSIVGCDNTNLHWVFVKSAWRHIGIAKSLVPSTIRSVTHTTSVGNALLRKRPEVVFDPFNIK